jgi:hypothetical protein
MKSISAIHSFAIHAIYSGTCFHDIFINSSIIRCTHDYTTSREHNKISNPSSHEDRYIAPKYQALNLCHHASSCKIVLVLEAGHGTISSRLSVPARRYIALLELKREGCLQLTIDNFSRRYLPTIAQHRPKYFRVFQEIFCTGNSSQLSQVHPHIDSNPTLKPQKSSFSALMMINVLSGGCI